MLKSINKYFLILTTIIIINLLFLQALNRKFKEMAEERREEMGGVDRRDIFSKPVRAGKRTYFFDVKATKKDEYYLTITESKKKFTPEGKPFYEKHKIFLYKEDFDKFANGLAEVVNFIKEEQPSDYIKTPPEGDLSNINFDDL